MNRDLARAIKDVDQHWTMLQACIRDRQWLYASLTLAGLTAAIDRLRALVDPKLVER